MQDTQSGAAYRRMLQQRVNDPPILSFGSLPPPKDAASPIRLAFSALAEPKGLPPNVQLLTLKDLGDGEVLLRLAHIFQVSSQAVVKIVL